MSTLKLTTSQWRQIRQALHEEYPKTVFMIRDKMKQVLGFTVREHTEWVKVDPQPDGPDWLDTSQEGWYRDKMYEYSIRLDFYNERKYTMFLLKYSELIGQLKK